MAKTKLKLKKGKLVRMSNKLRRNERFARIQIEERYFALKVKNNALALENARLLAQNETQLREKNEIWRQLMEIVVQNSEHRIDYSAVSKLTALQETVDNGHKQMQLLMSQSNKIYNEMVEHINGQIVSLVNTCNQQSRQALSDKSSHNIHKMSVESMRKSRLLSQQRISRLYHETHDNLSVINEQSNAETDTTICDTITGEHKRQSERTPSTQYEMTLCDDHLLATPSIYNLDMITINEYSNNTDSSRTASMCASLNSLNALNSVNSVKSPELTIEELNTTNERSYMAESTPMRTTRKGFVNNRMSKRISAINCVYSPSTSSARRSSLRNNIVSSIATNTTRNIKNTFESTDRTVVNSVSGVKRRKKSEMEKTVNSTDVSDLTVQNGSSYRLRPRTALRNYYYNNYYF